MSRKLFAVCLVALVMSSVSAGAETPVVAETPIVADAKPVTVVPDSSTTSTTTVAPTTASTTTTVATTTKAAPVTTTVAPITTTEAPVTTVAPPTPFPDPTSGNWSFYDPKANQTCIIVQFALQLNLTYTADNKTNNVLYNIPADASVASGSCANTTDSIVLQWNGNNNLNLTFEKNLTASRYDLASLQFQLNASTLFNATTDSPIALFYKQPNTFVTPLKYSYYCNRKQLFNLTASAASNETIATLALNNVHLEAFHESKAVSYSTAKDCDAIDTPDIVPIAVGCALAALVVVVLIAYLVGRRRAQNRGYLSM